jgi:hypothetical protein
MYSMHMIAVTYGCLFCVCNVHNSRKGIGGDTSLTRSSMCLLFIINIFQTQYNDQKKKGNDLQNSRQKT